MQEAPANKSKLKLKVFKERLALCIEDKLFCESNIQCISRLIGPYLEQWLRN